MNTEVELVKFLNDFIGQAQYFTLKHEYLNISNKGTTDFTILNKENVKLMNNYISQLLSFKDKSKILIVEVHIYKVDAFGSPIEPISRNFSFDLL